MPSIIKWVEALDSWIPQPERAIDKPFLMPVEDVFSISGRGTVVTGRIERGVIKVGDEIEIVGIRPTQKTIVTGVEMFRKLLDQGQAGDNAGLLLRGTKRDDVERGQVLCKPGSIKPHTEFEAEVYVLSKDEGGRHTRSSRATVRSSTSGPPTSPAPASCPRVWDGDAGRQREDGGDADQPVAMDEGLRSRSARAAAPSAPAWWPRSSSSPGPRRSAAPGSRRRCGRAEAGHQDCVLLLAQPGGPR